MKKKLLILLTSIIFLNISYAQSMQFCKDANYIDITAPFPIPDNQNNFNQDAIPCHNLLINNFDHNITITKNNTKVFVSDSIQEGAINKFLINIIEKSSNKRNPFRVEIDFSSKNTESFVDGAIFKPKNQYGDIINLTDYNLKDLSFKKIENNNRLQSIIALLPNGASIHINIPLNTLNNAVIIKHSNDNINLEKILSLTKPKIVKSFNNIFDEHESYRDVYIAVKKGASIIKGGKGDDYIITGKDNDDIYASLGNDTYIFPIQSGIDRLYINNYTRLNFNEFGEMTFIINTHIDSKSLKLYFNEKEEEIYLPFTKNTGVIFKETNEIHILYLRDYLHIKNKKGEAIQLEIENINHNFFYQK